MIDIYILIPPTRVSLCFLIIQLDRDNNARNGIVIGIAFVHMGDEYEEEYNNCSLRWLFMEARSSSYSLTESNLSFYCYNMPFMLNEISLLSFYLHTKI